MKKILILGGCGYIGSKLTNFLCDQSFNITVLDSLFFGKNLSKRHNLEIINENILNINDINFHGNFDTIIHLANIANDPSVELNPITSWETNVLATKLICDFAIKNKTKNLIFASSGSVYGVRQEQHVTEDLPLTPISTYNKTKMVAERVALSYLKDFNVYIIRPGTVCGTSNRLRLDLSVNALTYSALSKKIINVHGGDQIRPNIHIDDMVGVYSFFLNNINNIESGIYNASNENISIIEIAKKIQSIIPCEILIDKNTNDPRSYRIDSSKLKSIGYNFTKSIEDAIKELKDLYDKENIIANDNNYNVKTMKNFNSQ